MFWSLQRFCGVPVLLALVSGDAAYASEGQPVGQLQEAAMKVLRKLHGNSVPEPTACDASQWVSDHFARGEHESVRRCVGGEGGRAGCACMRLHRRAQGWLLSLCAGPPHRPAINAGTFFLHVFCMCSHPFHCQISLSGIMARLVRPSIARQQRPYMAALHDSPCTILREICSGYKNSHHHSLRGCARSSSTWAVDSFARSLAMLWSRWQALNTYCASTRVLLFCGPACVCQDVRGPGAPCAEAAAVCWRAHMQGTHGPGMLHGCCSRLAGRRDGRS